MQNITVNLNLNRGSCRILKPLYLGETVDLNFDAEGIYSLILTEPFADSPKDGIAVWAQSSEGKLALTRKALHNAFKKADATQPNMTISAKVFVQDESGATVADGEVVIEYSPAAYIMDTADYPTAEEILNIARNAANSAENSRSLAVSAAERAESHRSAAERAKDAAESAVQAAEGAKSAAERAVENAGAEAGHAAKEAADAREAATEAKNALASGSEVIKAAVEEEKKRAEAKELEIETNVAKINEGLNSTAEALNAVKDTADKASEALKTKADLVDGKIPASQIPGSVDDIEEVSSFSEFPAKGEANKIYLALDTNKAYRWGGSTYVEISPSIALGDTHTTAFPGNRGAAVEAAVAEEATRAKGAEAALDGRVKKLEENGGGSGGYRLVEQPEGDVQLQDRSMTHLTEANITKEWSAGCDEWDDETGDNIVHEATNVDWIKKESRPFIYDGKESFVARFPWLPGFLFPIVPVSDVVAGESYYFGDMLDEDGNFKYSIFDKIECTLKSITSQYLSYYNTIPQIEFVMTSEDDGGEFRGAFTDFNFTFSDELYDGEIMHGLEVYEYNVSFENDLVPPEVAEHPDGWWILDFEGSANELPGPGDTISCIAYWEDWDVGFEGPRYRVNMTFPEDMPDYTLSYAEKKAKASCKATIKNGDSQTELDLGDVTVSWGKEEEEQWDEETGDYVYIPRTFINISDSVYTLQIGVSLEFSVFESKYGSEMEEPSDFDVGRKVTVNALDVDADNFYSSLYSTMRVSEHFKLLPPEPDKHGGARDLLLCIDLPADRQIELPGVTEAEEGLFALTAGRTLISITEPVSGELYASARQLPTENA